MTMLSIQFNVILRIEYYMNSLIFPAYSVLYFAGPNQHRQASPCRHQSPRNHLPWVRQRAHADRTQGHRLVGAHRSWTAWADHRRQADRKDRRRRRHHHQPEEVQRGGRGEEEVVLHLRCHRPEAVHHHSAHQQAWEHWLVNFLYN